MIRHRLLLPSEAAQAVDAGGPLADCDPNRLREMSIAVVEVDGQIVAYWVSWMALHLEPLWVREDYRRHPAVIKGIVEETITQAALTGEPAAFCVIEEADVETVLPYAHRLGFSAAPGKLYYLVLTPAPAPVGG